MIARRVAMAAAAWLGAPADVEAYRRLTAAVEAWNDYVEPRMTSEMHEELLDELAVTSPPVLLGEAIPDLETALRRTARREV